MIRLIKTAEDYENALEQLEKLVLRSPSVGSPEADQLELLGVLIEEYERAHIPAPTLDPIEAIQFRMDQAGLTPRDLVPLIGSRSKVSEVLAGKRPLTLQMIRALNARLGIPTDSLIRSPGIKPTEGDELRDALIPLERFPIQEMWKRGWLRVRERPRKDRLGDEVSKAVEQLLRPVGGPEGVYALYRKNDHVRSGRTMDPYALFAWTARVTAMAMKVETRHSFVAATIEDDAWLDSFLQLSRDADGPVKAVKELAHVGVACVIEPHLPRTQLDGAAMRLPDGRPAIALTLRYDRIDSFWFTLMHELAHVVLHLSKSSSAADCFYDDLDIQDGIDRKEVDADAWASELLVPRDAWEASAARFTPNPTTVAQLASQIGVDEAIVAGKARHEFRNYRILNPLIGHGEVRQQFSDVAWGDQQDTNQPHS